MLRLAFSYKAALNKAWQDCVFREKYQFYNFKNYWDYEINLDQNSWSYLQMVSVGKDDNILGYLSASIDRNSNKISSVGAINFGDLNMTFSKDFYQFISELFTKHHFRKVEWAVVVGNPAEQMYDRIVAKYGGRIIGIRRESTVTADGVLRDEKEYELFQKDFIASHGTA